MAAGATFTSQKLFGANDKVRVAVVGVRGQGNSHIRAYQSIPNAEIAALVDIDESILDERLAQVEKATGKKPERYVDIRKLLEDKNIDAISIATPNHNHTLQTIWSLQAGKHVYCEKPLLAQHLRIEADCRGGAEVRQDRSGRRERAFAWRSAWKPWRRCAKA